MNKKKVNIILEIRNISTSFVGSEKTSDVVKDFNLKLYEKETLAIIGETGSGKTLSILSALDLLGQENHAKIEGESIFTHNNKKIDLISGEEIVVNKLRGKEIGIVFQNPQTALDPIVKCGKQIYRVVRKHLKLSKKEAMPDILKLFENLELSDPQRIYDAYPHELSGGELQRVMVAMAISCKPKLLILDEPTASLDLIIQAEMVNLLANIQLKYGLTLIYISHNLNLISNIADRIIHINEGRIIEVQPIKEFFEVPKHKLSKKLISQLKSHYLQNYSAKEHTEKIVEVKNVSKYFKTQKSKLFAASNIDLNIYKNEKLGIIGESGSGKSTLGKCIASIINDYEGEIGYNCKTENISYIFQSADLALDPELSVQSIIDEALRVRLKKMKRSERLKLIPSYLTQVKLSAELLDRFPGQLSGGQRQRVNLARALATKPELIICDEITSGLDLPIQIEIIGLLDELSKDISIVFISHDISLIKNICDRIVVMKNGKIEEEGLNHKVFVNSTSEYTLKLLGSMPKVKYFLNS